MLTILKSKDRVRSKVYLSWLAQFPCVKCGAEKGIQLHHTVSRKWAAGSDLLCVPLCYECHRKVSSKEDFGEWIIKFRGRYLHSHLWMYHPRIMLDLSRPLSEAFETWMIETGQATRGSTTRRKNRKP